MADDGAETTRRERPQGSRSKTNGHRSGRREARRIVQAALEQLVMLVDRPVTGIIGFGRRDGGWTVEAEVLELERVPDTMSILACYEIEVDEHGDLEGYRRVRRYARSAVEEG